MRVTKTVYKGGIIRYRNEKGEYHREDGPAIIDSEYKAWCINGKLHREDGPAVEWFNGNVEYWLNDRHYTEKEFNDYILKKKLQKIKSL